MIQPRANLPAPITIAPSEKWRGNNGQWSTMPLRLGSGSQIQYVEVLVSTASTYAFAISPAGCPPGLAVADCGTSRGMLYDYSKSSTWKYSGTNFSLGIEDAIGLDSNGYTGFEDQSLGFPGSPSSTAQINGSLLNTVADPLYWTGILGLNPRPTNLTQNFDNSTISFVQALKNAANIPSLSWAYGEGAKYHGDNFLTQLTLGGYDASQMQGSLLSIPMAPLTARDLVVGIQSITVPNVTGSRGSVDVLGTTGGINAFIDSTFPWIWLPESACMVFESAFGLLWNDTMGMYYLSEQMHNRLLAANPSVVFTLGQSRAAGTGPTVNITLPYAAFDLNATYGAVPGLSPNDNLRYFPLSRAQNDNETQFTLGRAFMQEAYLVADYERYNFTIGPRAFNSNSQPNVIAIQPLSANNGGGGGGGGGGLSGGAIAGVVVGVIGAVAIAALIAFFLIRRKRSKPEPAELGADAGGKPDMVDDPYQETYAKAELPSEPVASPGTTDYFASEKKHFAAEAPASQERFELPGSAIAELPSPPMAYEMPSPPMHSELPTPDTGSRGMPSPPTIRVSSPTSEASASTPAGPRLSPLTEESNPVVQKLGESDESKP